MKIVEFLPHWHNSNLQPDQNLQDFKKNLIW